MTIDGRRHLALVPTRNAAASGVRACPRCQSAVFSVSRRFIDLCISLFVPLRRYRCISMQCSWEGNLRGKRGGLPKVSARCGDKVIALDSLRIRRTHLLQKSRG